ncbi:hypothetical protein G3I59_13830 [Amycolatopsis rubida]|uniref:Uncharacterized protein n=1 Tax=Amycolatopsis rubida TaxID=112413 RepID=A0ABX0BQH2_9PSEU|nr:MULTISPECIES: hypothetical protein [Amycolatopsis]MYW91655.1 hypothetical protein [Amycolatopsis rubida]NEC56639.1 hypothetical protein [Amycolatopsis rubida]OAP24448.1 hypothetical protein A4R44_04839 [Amycolatopsis sp. M39]
MARRKATGQAGPVRTAAFPDGPDSLLLNPAISDAELRRERVRTALSPAIILPCLAGIAITLVGLMAGIGVVVVCAGVLLVGMSVVAGLDNVANFLTDHRHDAGSPCRLDRVRGEFFFRSRDFSELGEAHHAARILIDSVGELHRSPARTWIDPMIPGKAHQLVWQALCCLDRTRAARSLAVELAADPGSAVGDLAVAARESVGVIDGALSEVVRHVNACLVLVREWEGKLRHAELADLTAHTLAALPVDADVRRLAEFAEALPQNVFAYVTAARDVLGAGAFPWEQRSPGSTGEEGSS